MSHFPPSPLPPVAFTPNTKPQLAAVQLISLVQGNRDAINRNAALIYNLQQSGDATDDQVSVNKENIAKINVQLSILEKAINSVLPVAETVVTTVAQHTAQIAVLQAKVDKLEALQQ